MWMSITHDQFQERAHVQMVRVFCENNRCEGKSTLDPTAAAFRLSEGIVCQCMSGLMFCPFVLRTNVEH